jgi:hypothetical protein
MARELREAEIDHPVQLPGPVTEVLQEARAQPNELAQIARGHGGENGDRWPLLLPEASQANGIDRVGLRAHQVVLGKPPGTQRIDKGDREPLRGQRREQVLPVVPGRLHHDLGVGRRSQERQQLLVSLGVLAEGGGLLQDAAAVVEDGHHVPF